ncbi:MAG: ABC transporter permease, partial [Acidobacteriia bacterium]|nr:ABC transporter permease [Terriglobia bacterium]
MEIFRKDLQLAVRTLLKSPGFAAIAVLTLTLGIAVNATMFSLVSAFLLRRPPCQEPERIAVVSSIDPTPGFESDTNPVSAPNYLAWREANHVFTDMAAAEEHRSVSLNLGNRPLSIYAAVVTASYFNVLGVKPQLGRTFDTGEDLQGRDRVAILSYGLWEQYFASDTHIPGQTVRINRELYTIIGVMPKNFKLLGYTPQLWIPLVLNQGDQTAAAHKNRTLHVFARLKPGVTLEQAGAEMATLARRTQQDFPDTEKQWGAAVRTLPDFLIYDFGIRSVLALTMTVVGFVLMIACTNVAGLLLARVAGRQREISIRLALGAGRLRIIRQLLTEGLLIAMLGLGLGLLLTYWGVRFVQASMTFNEAFSAVTISLDSNVLIFAAVTSLISAALCGLAPSLKASRTDITSNLKDESHGSSGGR